MQLRRQMHVLNRLAAVAMAGAWLLGACDGAPQTPSGARAGGLRLAALSPAIGVILRDLGLADRIVARHAFDKVTPGSIPSAGDQAGIDYEVLLRAEPTHVLLQWGARDLPPRLLELGAARGWVVETYPLLTLAEIKETTGRIASLADDAEVTARAEALCARIDGAVHPDPDVSERAGVCLALYWTDPPGAAGPGSFHQQILAGLGVRPALTEGGAYVTLDPEDVKRLAPDSILLLMEGADETRVTELLGPLSGLGLACVREGRVAVVSHPLVNLPATSIVEVVEEIVADIRAMPPRGTDR
jgi:ABC-type Fe3+-hydroxamate transport system substrate-binding protein